MLCRTVGACCPEAWAGSERDATDGLERVFSCLVEPLARQCPVWRHGVGFIFACVCDDHLTILANVFGGDEQALSVAEQALT